MKQIHVYFVDTPQGRAELRFARDLAEKLGVEITVDVHYNPAANTCFESAGIQLPNTSEHAASLLPWLNEIAGGPVEIRFTEEPLTDIDGLVVSNAMARAGNVRVPVFASVYEPCLNPEGRAICIPFGNRGTALVAACLAIPLAAKLGVAVVLYHTTWCDKNNASKNPRDHMCEDAQAIETQLLELAETHGVSATSVIEMVDDVADGGIRFAIAQHCCLMAMAYGERILRKPYSDSALKASPVPILIVPRKGE